MYNITIRMALNTEKSLALLKQLWDDLKFLFRFKWYLSICQAHDIMFNNFTTSFVYGMLLWNIWKINREPTVSVYVYFNTSFFVKIKLHTINIYNLYALNTKYLYTWDNIYLIDREKTTDEAFFMNYNEW